jgi:uncharacterized protein (DUF924 family)
MQPLQPTDVLNFWFGNSDAVDPRWFNGGDAFDALIRSRHAATVQAALDGALDSWASPAHGPQGSLALILVLDQFTRNIHRGTPLAFAGDARALALAQGLVDGGGLLQLGLLQRWFALMPYEHSEDPAVQHQSVLLFTALHHDAAGGPHAEALAGALDYAHRHESVVCRFGRFPHRNAILGRPSTDAELAFLQLPGSRF